MITIRKIVDKDLSNLAELFVTVFNADLWCENWTKEWA